MRCQTLWRNARLATMAGPGLGVVDDGLIAADAVGIIAWTGPAADAPAFDAAEIIDCEGRWITPALIDCHTHLVFAGERAGEFERRIAGESYAEIARAGGGILSTVAATRRASEAELVAAALPRLDEMIAHGVGTVEIKSGYGLTLADELKMLRAARALGEKRPVRVAATLLAAHAAPPEYRPDRADAYVDRVCEAIIPAAAAAGLADAVDVFCETIAFTPAQAERVFAAARVHGLPVKIHAEQLSGQGGAALAARFGALSADHLEHLDEAGAAALAAAGTVAVLLPAAGYFTGEAKRPPVETLRRAGARIAIATDCNPGTAPLTSPLIVMNMAAVLFGLTTEECLLGFTLNAAAALGLATDIGSLEAGKRCELAIWDVESPAELVYWIGRNPLHQRIWGGR